MREQNLRVLWLLTAVLLVLSMAILSACGDSDDGVSKPEPLTGTCESCHQDKDLLVATASPVEDNGGEDSGEG